MNHVLPKVGFVLLTASAVLFSFSATADSSSETQEGLKQILLRYPEADLNKDGVLTLEEAKGFRTRLWQQETDTGTPVERTTPAEASVAPIAPAEPLLSNVAYGEGPGQHFDLWLPRDTKPPCPAVFCLSLGKETSVPPADLLKKCLQSGFAVGVLHGSEGGDEATYFDDVAQGLRFLYDNAHAHGVEGDRIALFGQGAAAEYALYGALLTLEKAEKAGGIRCAALLDAPVWEGAGEMPEPEAYLERAYPRVSHLLAEPHGKPVIALLYSGQNAGDLLMQALHRSDIDVTLNNAAENEGVPHLIRQAVLFFRKQLNQDAGEPAPETTREKEKQ